jgi:hypothetical protein
MGLRSELATSRENLSQEETHEIQILNNSICYRRSGICFGGSKRPGTMRFTHEGGETGKLEQFAYWRSSPHAGSVPEVE